MKKIYSLLLLGGLLFFGAENSWATVDWSQGGTLYVRNIKPSGWSVYWKSLGGWLKIDVIKSDDTHAYIETGDIVAGDWDGESVMTFTNIPANAKSFKIYRGAGESTYNSTDYIPFESGKNYIRTYSENSSSATWNDLEWDEHTDWYFHISALKDESSWGSGIQFKKASASATTATAKVNLTTTASSNWYKLYIDSDNPGNMTAYKYTAANISGSNNSNLTFVVTSGNSTLVPTIAGEYTFTLDFSTATSPTISVTFPSTYTRAGVASGNFGTINLPCSIATLTGATAYSILYKRVDGSDNPTSIVLAPAGSSDLAAGPYIIEYTSSTLTATLSGDRSDTYSAYGLTGNLGTDAEDVSDGNYVVVGNEARKVNGGTVKCGQYFAYISLTSVQTEAQYLDNGGSAPSNIREIPMSPNTTTDLENVATSENVVKFIENGQLYILRNGIVYDAMGRAVK